MLQIIPVVLKNKNYIEKIYAPNRTHHVCIPTKNFYLFPNFNMIERERTYILSKLPGNLHEYSMKDIVDLYIPLRCGMAQLRARKK
jgi:hypothetical protein